MVSEVSEASEEEAQPIYPGESQSAGDGELASTVVPTIRKLKLVEWLQYQEVA